jgi:hypothetical protein
MALERGVALRREARVHRDVTEDGLESLDPYMRSIGADLGAVRVPGT